MRKVLLLLIALIGTTAFAAEITPTCVVAEMNVRRAVFGLPPLHADARLEEAAGDRISDMDQRQGRHPAQSYLLRYFAAT